MAYGYNDSFVGGHPPVQIQRVGGWKALAGAMLAAAGLGFAGYVYLGPYQKLTKEMAVRTAELGEERTSSQDVAAERDKLKRQIAERDSADQNKAASQSRRQQAVDAFAAELKTPLAAFGATVSADGGRARVGFATSSMFDQPTSTVISPQGEAALKVLAGSLKKAGFRVGVLAKLITTPPPRELAQFKNIGEFAMLRAVRVALGLVAGGVAPDRIAATGDNPPTTHKGKPAVPDHLEIEIEPE
ncbi:MAG: hypothetical protein ABIS92_04225 [Polyangia bacterium]